MAGDEPSRPVARQAATGKRQAMPVGQQEVPVGRQDTGRTVTVAEATRLLGKSADAVRSALRRQSLDGYRDNQGEWRVLLAGLPSPTGDGRGAVATGNLDPLRQELDWARDELRQARQQADDWQRQASDRQAAVAELRERVARLEGEAIGVQAMLAAKDAVIAAKEETVAAKEVIVAGLLGRLNQRPWWRRLIG